MTVYTVDMFGIHTDWDDKLRAAARKIHTAIKDSGDIDAAFDEYVDAAIDELIAGMSDGGRLQMLASYAMCRPCTYEWAVGRISTETSGNLAVESFAQALELAVYWLAYASLEAYYTELSRSAR